MLLHEAEAQLKQIDAAIALLSKKAYRTYAVTLEVMIARYQVQMRMLLGQYTPRFVAMQGDKAHTKILVDNFVADLHRIAEHNIIAAANVGYARCLSDLKLHGKVRNYSTPVAAPHLVYMKSIAENNKYLTTSLQRDMVKRLSAVKNVDEMPKALAVFNSRLDMYGHWLWRTSEAAYIYGMRDFERFRKSRKELRA